MIEYKTTNINGVDGWYNLKTGQFIPTCCKNCSRLLKIKNSNSEFTYLCGINIFLPILKGTCRRQLKDQMLIKFYYEE
jgi:hypothetical protein